MPKMLTATGQFWVFLSTASALLCSTGFFLPYWIQGNIYNLTVHLGVFRRCNFLVKRENGLSVFKEACGRYASFQDIPSEAWKACTVMIGIGCGFLLLVAFTGMFSCCFKDIASRSSTRVGGTVQFLAGNGELTLSFVHKFVITCKVITRRGMLYCVLFVIL